MRITFTCLLVVFVYTANAQFSIQPQIGLENTRTAVKYNDQSVVPVGMQFSPMFAVQMDYKSKQGHGAFVGVSTSSPAIDFQFSDLQTAATSYNASRQNIQLRFEGGYEFSTKPIYFSKGNTSNTPAYKPANRCAGREQQSCSGKVNCQQHSCAGRMNCGQHSREMCSKDPNKTMAKNNGSYMRIIPSVGVAFIPSQPSEIETKTQGTQTTYDYKAGAWNTALIAGTAFEFGNNRHAKFIVNINYLKGIGNMDTKTINSVSNGKAVSSTISSNTSGWNVKLGIPLSFSKKPQQRKQCERSTYNGKCGQERSQFHGRCGQYRMFMQ